MELKPLAKHLKLAAWFARAYPLQGALTVAGLLLAGALEGVGIAAMLPLIQVVVASGTGSETEVGQAVERAFRSFGVEPTLGPLLVFIVVALWLKSGLTLLAMTQVGYAAARVTRDMRSELIRALMRVRWEYFSRERAGNFTAAVSSEAQRSANAYLQICQILAAGIQVAVYFTLAFLVSWWATLGAVAVGGLTVLVLSRFISMARQAGGAQNVLIRSFNSRLIEGLTAMKAIKAMGQERRLLPLMESEIEGLNHAQRRMILSAQSLKTLQEPILVLVIAAGLFFLLDVWSGRLEVLFAIVLLFFRTVTRANMVHRYYQVLVQSEPAFWFVRSLADTVGSAAESFRGTREPSFERAIEFDRVSFAYDDAAVLKDVSLTIPARKFTSITGASGAGKTTAVDLIIGLLRPTSGEIHVDGVPMAEIDIARWRGKIGYVPQETVLFHDTIRANVTLGDPDLSRDDVEEALQRAGAWGFVSRLPAGMDSVVGERGMRLSGGQRQRISIARALVRRPELLILDEATSSLDPDTEAAICGTLRHLVGTVTILAISHQPALVATADRVYRVEGGTIRRLGGEETAEAAASR